MTCKTEHSLLININGQQNEIAHLDANKTRVLVRVPINLQYKNDQIVDIFNEKIKEYIDKLSASPLRPSNILFGY